MKPKRLIEFSVTLVLVLLVCISLFPSVQAVEVTEEEKTISALNNLAGLDASKYAITTQTYPNYLFQETLPKTMVKATLNNSGGEVDVMSSFVNGELEGLTVYPINGSPCMRNSVGSDVVSAQRFLANCESESKNALYGTLASMLSTVEDHTNCSSIVGNVKLSVTEDEYGTAFNWTYTSDGLDAPEKYVALTIEDGVSTYFFDDWSFYTIERTSVKLSERQAIDVAMSAAKNYGGGVIGGIQFNVTNGMIMEKVLSSSLCVDKARSPDPFELYPMYRVWVSLDKFYPGYIYGFNVYVWADTGEVCYLNPRVSTFDPPQELLASASDACVSNQTSTSPMTFESGMFWLLVLVSVAALAVVVWVPVYLWRKKKVLSLVCIPKIRLFRVWGVLLVFLVLFSLLWAALSAPVVSAARYGAASVWGSESSASRMSSGESWRKSNDEVVLQRATAEYIALLFHYHNYNSEYNQGSEGYSSYRDQFLSRLHTLETSYPRVAVVDFDHGVGNVVGGDFHYMVEDQRGTLTGSTPHSEPIDHPEYGIYDKDIYEQTVGDRTFFAFINTCLSAKIDYWVPTYNGNEYPVLAGGGLVNGTAQGMPYAWTHRHVCGNPSPNQLSDNGYSNPAGSCCYIGFPSGSASLNQTVGSGGYQYYYWVYHFFHYALEIDCTIHQALDWASHDTFNCANFADSPLFDTEGFTAVWPIYNGAAWIDEIGSNSHMAVYGNANIKLYQPLYGDLNADNKVNYVDISVFMDAYSAYYSGQAWNHDADFNGDSKLNYLDISIFIDCYIYYYGGLSLLYIDSVASSGELDAQLLDDGESAVLGLASPSVLPSVGGCFNVTVHVTNAADLRAWGGGLSWDSSVLQLCNVSEGSFLSSIGDTMFLCSIMDPLVANGSLQDICGSSLSGGVNGSGDLATLTFEVMSAQPTSINFTCGELFSTAGESMPCTLENLTIAQDVLVSDVECGVGFVQSGGFVFPVNVTLQNLGNITRIVELNVYANDSIVGQTQFGVAANCSVAVCCLGNSSMLPAGNYSLGAFVFVVDELDCSFGHSLFEGEVLVTYAGDLTGDFRVNFFDIGAFMDAYSNYVNYAVLDPAADYDHDGDIDAVDYVLFNAAYIAYYSQH